MRLQKNVDKDFYDSIFFATVSNNFIIAQSVEFMSTNVLDWRLLKILKV